jgi:hypothetical protein
LSGLSAALESYLMGDRKKYAAFWFEAKAKLSGDYKDTPDEEKMRYAVSRCSEHASDEKALRTEHPHTLTSVSQLGLVLKSQGRLIDVENL